jgi:hypothetical protein
MAVNYRQFMDDFLATDNQRSVASSKTSQANPMYVALAKFLSERNTDLFTLVVYMDKGNTGIARETSVPSPAKASLQCSRF